MYLGSLRKNNQNCEKKQKWAKNLFFKIILTHVIKFRVKGATLDALVPFYEKY